MCVPEFPKNEEDVSAVDDENEQNEEEEEEEEEDVNDVEEIEIEVEAERFESEALGFAYEAIAFLDSDDDSDEPLDAHQTALLNKALFEHAKVCEAMKHTTKIHDEVIVELRRTFLALARAQEAVEHIEDDPIYKDSQDPTFKASMKARALELQERANEEYEEQMHQFKKSAAEMLSTRRNHRILVSTILHFKDFSCPEPHDLAGAVMAVHWQQFGLPARRWRPRGAEV